MAHAGQCEDHLQLGYLQLNPYPMLTRIDNALLDSLCTQAAASPRRRKNHNLHTSDTALAHRLLNAVQTDSYIAPHRHLDPSKDETFVVLRGLMGLIIFDDAGFPHDQGMHKSRRW
jgi:cupin fold WbuC family metalloprotein